MPKAVICLVSALQFHELTVMLPSQVWIAIDRTARKPRIAAPPLRVFRFTGLAYTAGVETHTIGGVAVRIYAPAKTVVDCFRYRRKIGVDIAIEAMREALKVRKCRPNDIVRYAKQCGAWTVIQPYLDALTIDGP